MPLSKIQQKQEEEESHEMAASSARVVYKAILEEGEEELRRPTLALAFSGLAAGLSMGFSMVGEGLLHSHLPDVPWRPLIAKLGYSMGFLIVVLGRQQLFTENTLTAILPLLKHKHRIVLFNVLRMWVTVLAANLVGATIFAWVVAKTNVFDDGAKRAFLEIGRAALQPPFATVLLRGIFAGWLIALMVWLLPVAETARIWVIIFVTYIVGLGPSSHIVAGSVEALYTVAVGDTTLGHCITGNMIPALIGNTIGGVALVAALNYAQVFAGSAEK
jgi:formate/nitrite transporter FocA (FNT family)